MSITVGCNNNHLLQHHLDEYQSRMANVLDVKNQDSLKTSLPPYPALKDLEQKIPETTIKLFEFYTLKHCELYSIVAERNTSLGNLQLPSTRYIYERHLIDALNTCLLDTEDPKLRDKLTKWQEIKTKQLPLVWADLIQLSSETKYGFSTNVGLVEGSDQDGLSQIKESLNYLLQINQNKQVNSTELERHLQTLKSNPLPAKLWLSQRVLAQNLHHSTKWLLQHTQSLQCSGKAVNKKLEYLTNVFQRFFIEKIQPIASQINHYQYQLAPMFNNMMENPNLSSSFKLYIEQFNQQGFQNYQTEMQQHIQFWQSLFERCNMKPGQG